MRRSAPSLTPFAAGMLLLAGCATSPGLRFLNFVGLQKKPLIVALVAEERALGMPNPVELLNPFTPYQRLNSEMGDALGRSVGADLCLPIQLEPALRTGLAHLAVVTPARYARLAEPTDFPVLAVTADERGRVARPAVLVVQADAPIRSVSDLRGQVVAFGPVDNARTHLAALELLSRAGLKRTDLSLELLPLPGLKHLLSGRSVAQSVLNGSSAAGFIDLAEWENLTQQQAAAPEQLDTTRLRIVANTIAVPDRLFIASPRVDSADAEQIQVFLYAADERCPDALRPLAIGSLEPATPEILAACVQILNTTAAESEPSSKTTRSAKESD